MGNKKIVVAVLTEPIGGTLTQKNLQQMFSEYIPVYHVKWLQQAGLTVIPVSYQSTKEDLDAILSQVNAVVVPGEQHIFKTNQIYQVAVSYIISHI